MKYGKQFFFLILIYLFCTGNFVSASDAPEPLRGLWVIRHVLTSPQKIDSMLALARRCGFTDLFVQVRGRGDAYYNSKYEPKARAIADPTFDPLEYLLDRTEGDSLRIHAWVNVFYIWSADKLPGDQNHLVNRQADWLARPLNQRNVLSDYPRSMKRVGAEGLYISPMLPQAQQYLIRLCTDLLGSYPVAGLHLDYIRYPNQDFDVHPYILRQFRHRYIIDPTRFLRDGDEFARTYTLAGYESYFGLWRRYLMDGLSGFVEKMAAAVREEFPDVLLTAAVKPDIVTAHWKYYQDWDRWLREGWLDYAVPMNYAVDSETFRERLNQYVDKIPLNKCLVGISLYNQPPEDAIDKINLLFTLRNAGFVLFSYDQLREQIPLQNYLKNELESMILKMQSDKNENKAE